MTPVEYRWCSHDRLRRPTRARRRRGTKRLDGHRPGPAHPRGSSRGRPGAGKRRRAGAIDAACGAPRRGAAAAAGRVPVPTFGIRNPWAGWRATWRKSAAGRRTSPKARCSVTGQSVVGQQIAEHATPIATERRGAQRDGRIDGLGDAVADDSGAAVGKDRRGGRQRCGDVAENHRPGGAVVAQGSTAHRRQGSPRHLWIAFPPAAARPQTGVSHDGRLRAARTPQTWRDARRDAAGIKKSSARRG